MSGVSQVITLRSQNKVLAEDPFVAAVSHSDPGAETRARGAEILALTQSLVIGVIFKQQPMFLFHPGKS